jgi:hypothetical protein
MRPAGLLQGEFMNQPHLTITVIHSAPAPEAQAAPAGHHHPWPALPHPAASVLMRIACATEAGFEPGEDHFEGDPSTDGLDDSAAQLLEIAALGQTTNGLEMWMPLTRSRDSLNLLGESGVMVVGVNELGWVVYDWVPGP